MEEFKLTVIVEGEQYCNDVRFYADRGFQELSCGLLEVTLAEVERVSAQSAQGDLRCVHHIASREYELIFACDWL